MGSRLSRQNSLDNENFPRRRRKHLDSKSDRSGNFLCTIPGCQDLGLEGMSLNDILYKNASFLNLVDPISHELLLSLAKDMQCPKKDSDTQKSSDKICRQLIYHLTPHSKWLRKSMTRRKAQAW
ncbi:hypothetical protein cypCar_00015085 [Cyprinus carpio]|nr:hypothetical protein cypCar_00015085 [Cyprinus carpio]